MDGLCSFHGGRVAGGSWQLWLEMARLILPQLEDLFPVNHFLETVNIWGFL